MTEFPQAHNDASPGPSEAARAAGARRQENVEYSDEDRNSPLLPEQQCTSLNKEWQAIQARFVDSPRIAVEAADTLVRKTIDTLANSFGEMRASLDKAWETDREISTEELRLAFQNYRSFFQRLLSI